MKKKQFAVIASSGISLFVAFGATAIVSKPASASASGAAYPYCPNPAGGCALYTCDIVPSGVQAAKWANDTNVPYSICHTTVNPFFYNSDCENDTKVVCAVRYIYNGQTDCEGDVTFGRKKYEVVRKGCKETGSRVDDPDIPNWGDDKNEPD